ncbi:hypothetical protein ABZU42_22320 [Micromonospora profundi]|uniref:hypothetical protein n=1 Tax=Micromonospora profundi TaxID=1420889 RepID=UPI0033A21B2A
MRLTGEWITRSPANLMIAAALLLPALLSRGVLARGLGTRAMVLVGERSYSKYLIQSIYP